MTKTDKAYEGISARFTEALGARCFKDQSNDTVFNGDKEEVQKWFDVVGNKFTSVKETSIPFQFVKYLVFNALNDEGKKLIRDLLVPTQAFKSQLFVAVDEECADENGNIVEGIPVVFAYKGRSFNETANPNTVGVLFNVRSFPGKDESEERVNFVYGALSKGSVQSEYRYTSICALYVIPEKYLL